MTFVSGTNGYTLQLEAASKGNPLEFSFALYRGDALVRGPFAAQLPALKMLPRVDQDVLSLRNSGDLPAGVTLPVQEMHPVVFSNR
jgi:hypothetical protein